MHNITAAINRNECHAHAHKHTIIILYIDKVWQLFKSIISWSLFIVQEERREGGREGKEERERERERVGRRDRGRVVW